MRAVLEIEKIEKNDDSDSSTSQPEHQHGFADIEYLTFYLRSEDRHGFVDIHAGVYIPVCCFRCGGVSHSPVMHGSQSQSR